MNKSMIALLAALASLGAIAQEAAPAPAAEATSATAPSVETTAAADEQATAVDASKLQDEGIDEIDLEEEDDAALAAKKPTIKGNLDKGTISLVDIECDDATLADILRQFRKTTGANIICDDSTNLMRRVSVSLRKVPWLQGLTAILGSRGFRLDERENIYRVVEDLQLIPVSTRTFVLNHASAKELATLFNSSYGKKDPTGKMIQQVASSFEGANVVVVTATEKVLADCEKIIKAVDRPVLQSYIEARFVELDAGSAKKLGMKWDALASGWQTTIGPFSGGGVVSTAKPSTIGSGTTLTGAQKPAGGKEGTPDLAYKNAWGLAGEMSAGEFAMTLQAIESMDNSAVFSNPRIIVANEHKASVDMTTKFPNVRITASRTTQSGSTSMDISAQIEQIPGDNVLMFSKQVFYAWGITLDVTPRISPDGLITVDIVPTISQLNDDATVSKNGFYDVGSSSGDNATPYSRYPVIDMKRIESQFTMKDGSTAVIGGLSKTVDEIKEQGVPWLRNIPWLGPKLFTWKSHVKTQKEIIIFVTVGIANPEALPKEAGLPKNAILGREFVEGRRLEPGDAGLEKTLRIDGVEFESKDAVDASSKSAVPAPEEHRGTVIITPVYEIEEGEEGKMESVKVDTEEVKAEEVTE